MGEGWKEREGKLESVKRVKRKVEWIKVKIKIK